MYDQSSPRKVILHIGSHKTASTFIRQTLYRPATSEWLTQLDTAVVDRKSLMDSEFFKYLELVTSGNVAFEAELPEAVVQSAEEIFCQKDKTVLVTCEDMFRRLRLEDFYQNIGPGLQLIQRILPETQIEVIFYVRKQKAFVESCYTQLIQIGRSLSFEEYIGGSMPTHLLWSKVCDDIASVIGKEALHVNAFEVIKSVGQTQFMKEFLAYAGFSADQIATFDFETILAEESSKNRGFSQVAVDVARFTMPMLQYRQRKTLRRFLQKQFSNEHFPRPKYFSDEEANQIADYYREDNTRLFSKYILDRSATDLGYV